MEITKESEDIYAFQIATSTWKMIDMNLGPQNLNFYFDSIKAQSSLPEAEKFKIKEARSLPDLKKALKENGGRAPTEAGEETLNATSDNKGLSGGLLSGRKDIRQAKSVAAMSRGRAGRTGSLSRLPYVPKKTFGMRLVKWVCQRLYKMLKIYCVG